MHSGVNKIGRVKLSVYFYDSYMQQLQCMFCTYLRACVTKASSFLVFRFSGSSLCTDCTISVFRMRLGPHPSYRCRDIDYQEYCFNKRWVSALLGTFSYFQLHLITRQQRALLGTFSYFQLHPYHKQAAKLGKQQFQTC